MAKPLKADSYSCPQQLDSDFDHNFRPVLEMTFTIRNWWYLLCIQPACFLSPFGMVDTIIKFVNEKPPQKMGKRGKPPVPHLPAWKKPYLVFFSSKKLVIFHTFYCLLSNLVGSLYLVCPTWSGVCPHLPAIVSLSSKQAQRWSTRHLDIDSRILQGYLNKLLNLFSKGCWSCWLLLSVDTASPMLVTWTNHHQ